MTAPTDVPAWFHDAACNGCTRQFYDWEHKTKSDSGQRMLAIIRRICEHCPVTQQCRDYALEHHDETEGGVWGGLTYDERRAIIRARHRKATR